MPAAVAERAKHRRIKPSSWLRELPVLIGIALVLALLIKTFLVQAFFIPSESMEKTLLVGDRVLVNKLSRRLDREIERGQVVVFRDPGGWLPSSADSSGNPVSRGLRNALVFIGLLPSDNQNDLIKRVIAVGGDRVACSPPGKVTVNGVALDEPYIGLNRPCVAPFDVTVPPNRLWVMGDNRQNSADSSAHQDNPGMGTIPEEAVVGRAFVIVWPLVSMGRLPIPETFQAIT